VCVGGVVCEGVWVCVWGGYVCSCFCPLVCSCLFVSPVVPQECFMLLLVQ